MYKLLLTICLIGCVSSNAGIYRGDRKEASHVALSHQPQFDCVGQIFLGNEAIGSCVLINKKFVLSAAHCFPPHHSKSTQPYTFAFMGKRYVGKKITNHPLYDYNSDRKNDYDISVIELKETVTNVLPATLCSQYDELYAHCVGVGYGYICRADDPGKTQSPKKFAGENVIDSIGGFTVNNMRGILFFDFDCPVDSKYHNQCNKMGSDVPENLEYLPNGGDSGGGLFRKGKNGWELMGILSGGGTSLDQFRKTFYYGQVAMWTRVSVFADWIEQCEKE